MSGTLVTPVFDKAGAALAATGSTPSFTFSRPFNITISGTWVGSWALEKQAPDGSWVNCVLPDGSLSAWTTNGFWAIPNVWQNGVTYRITFTQTSGTLEWEVSR